MENNIKHTYDCMICGNVLEYSEDYSKVECMYCHGEFQSNVRCKEGHYICDACHSLDGYELIDKYCRETDKTNPIEMAIELMKSNKINMHGPEHHFLVPAVLLTSYYNIKGDRQSKIKKLEIAKTRARDVKGGICGFYGNCGAAVGTGIYISVITEATPLTKQNWGLANLMTGTALIELSKTGGPRCCKRNLFTSIREAAKRTEENLGVRLYDYEGHRPVCIFKSKNRECLKSDCPYFK